MTRLPALLLLTALAGTATVVAQSATFSSKLEAVRVDVLVTDGSKVVRGLGPADFEIFDDGVRQQVDLAGFEELPVNMILALDASDSMTGERLNHLRAAGHTVLGGLTRDDRGALLTFSHRVSLSQGLTGDLELVRRQLDAVDPSGETALIDGVYAALMHGGSGAGRDLLIVFSDGVDTASWLAAPRVIEASRRSEVTVYAVSVRGAGETPFLEELSEQTGGAVVEVESTTDLGRTFAGILAEFRQRYVVSYSPQGVARDGWHQLRVGVRDRRLRARARAGYLARQ